MNTIKIAREEDYAIVQLDRGRSNPINQEMLDDLQKAFEDFSKDATIKGVILAGKEKFFSSGLDVIELYGYNEEQIAKLFKSLFETIGALLAFPKPIVAAITGHSPAGGCVLALCCDYRVMASGKFRIGLNEIPVGIIMPEYIYELMAYWIGAGKAFQCIANGALLSGEEAQALSLIDELVSEEEVMERSILQLKKFQSFSSNTWSVSKSNMRAPLLQHFKEFNDASLKALMSQWWSNETRTILGALVAQLTQK